MAGPWEKYAAPSETGPWTKYAPPPAPTQDEYSGTPTTIDYQPPARDDVPRQGGLGDPGTLSGAVVEGWQNAPSVWTSPEARQTVANLPISGPILAPAGDIFSGILGAGNALLRGAQHVLATTAEPVGRAVPEIRIPGYGPISGTVVGGPGLGRDVAALPEAFPTGDFSGGTVGPQTARNQMMPPERPQFVSERMAPPRAPGMTDAERIQQLIQHDIVETNPAPSFVPPGTPRPDMPAVPTNDILRFDPSQVPPRPAEIPPTTTKDPVTGEVQPIQQPSAPAAGEAKPQSAGAMATPYDLSKMDLDETKAARTTAEWQELLEPTRKGDTTEHVPGVKPTKAEIEQSAPVSTESKLLRQEFREPYSEDEASKMETIRNKLEDTAGTATVANSMERARDAKAAAQRDAIWANKSEADTTPLYKYQTDMLASEDGARPLVRNAVDRVIKELTDADGNPITDPQKLYGVRKHIDDLIAEQGASGKPANERAMAQLLGMKKVLDQQVIEPAAPGFMKYLSDYHEASKPIDVMKYLQAKVPGLMTGPNRNITFSKFDKFMKDLAIERAQKDYGGAEAMDEGTRQTLMGIWRHLQRSASDAELAKVNGSDTTQRMMQLLRTGAVQAAVHTAVGTVTGGLGNVFVPIIGEQFHRSGQMKKVQQHLNPDLSKYPMPPRNELGP